jgi:hypothetical protein
MPAGLSVSPAERSVTPPLFVLMPAAVKGSTWMDDILGKD